VSAVVTLNPATGERLAEYPAFSDADVDAAVERATAAQGGWAGLSFPDRALVLRRAAEILRVEDDVRAAVRSGVSTRDLGGSASTSELTVVVVDAVRAHPPTESELP
jgi:succinate-semialdehyde dehydrogenase/glutarate-semialdehyde dehydrogenase